MNETKLRTTARGNAYRCLLLLVLSWVAPFTFAALSAQDMNVKGKVTDSSTGEALVGAAVTVEGTSRGTVVNASGAYSINVPKDATLVFTVLGYETQRVPVESRTTIEVRMVASAQEIEEIVAIGYGTARKSDLTSAISMIREKDISKTPVNSIDQALQGNAPGVLVINTSAEPGATVSVRIRGGSSISGDNEPLIVIDDIPADNTTLTLLNPADVKSMEVLKDAAATAIFGSRGANGVILVTTKAGSQGVAKLSVNAKYGVSTPSKYLPMMDGPQYAGYDNFARMNWGVNSVKTMRTDTLGTANFQDLLIRDMAIRQEYNVQVSGGAKESTYYVSAGYLGNEGILNNSGEDRMSLRSKFIMKLARNLDMNMGASLSRTEVQKVAGGGSGAMLRTNMLSPLSGKEGQTYTDGMFVDEETGEIMSIQNETARAMHGNDWTKAFRGDANGTVTWRINRYMKFAVTGSYSYSNSAGYRYVPRVIYVKQSDIDKNNTAERNSSISTKWTNTNTLSYERTFCKKHYLNAILAEQWESSVGDGFGIKVRRFDTDYYMWNNLAAATYYETPSTSDKHNSMLSVFGRVIYTYDKRYTTTVTLREDGSSRFGEDRKFGFFPSVSAGWTVSNEKFLKNAKAVSNLKLRASWGITGNDRIGDLQSISLLNSSKIIVNGASYTGTPVGTLGNPNLQWETTQMYNTGVDLSLFKNRVSLTVEAYLKKTSHMLYDYRIPRTSGYSKLKANIGGMENRGLEFDLHTVNVETKSFSWTTAFNVGLNASKVTDLGGNDEVVMYYLGDNVNQNITFLQVGQPMPVFKGYRTSIYQSWDEVYADDAVWVEDPLSIRTMPGMLRYHDTNGDGVIDDGDKVVLGHAIPNGMGGFTNTFTYKNLSLTIFFNGAWGNSVMNTNAAKLMRFKAGADNQLRTMLDVYRPANPVTGDRGYRGGRIPIPTSNSAASTARDYIANLTDYWVEDGSYLRLKSLSLSYTLPRKWTKKVGMNSVMLSAIGSNLFTWTHYTGYDPEMSSSYGSSNDRIGIDQSSYPPVRTVTFSANITF